MSDYDILLVNPPMTSLKRSKLAQFGSLHLVEGVSYHSFNPGLLSIGTYLDWKGYSVKILDLYGEQAPFPSLQRYLDREKPAVIGISCTYGLCYLPALEAARIAKRSSRDSLIIAGGEHIGPLGPIALIECEELDVIVKYEGEVPTQQLIEFSKGNIALAEIKSIVFQSRLLADTPSSTLLRPAQIPLQDPFDPERWANCANGDYIENSDFPEVADLNEMPFLKYDLYPNYLSYPPYVEESRGCAWKCEFCASPFLSQRRMRIKDSERFLDELENAISIYGNEIQYPVLAATFGVKVDNTVKICEGIKERFGQVNWMSTFRVDIQWKRFLKPMYESGCKMFAVGMESASPDILRLMSKTTNPDKYIQMTEDLITSVSRLDNPVMHLNLMFYMGETPKTIKETTKFVMKWVEKIHSVYYSPMIAYPSTDIWARFEEYSEKTGASLAEGDPWNKMHIYPVNPSKYFNHADAGYFARMMEKVAMKEDEYYRIHEARLVRGEDGKISDDVKEQYLKDKLYAAPI